MIAEYLAILPARMWLVHFLRLLAVAKRTKYKPIAF